MQNNYAYLKSSEFHHFENPQSILQGQHETQDMEVVAAKSATHDTRK